MNIYLLSTTSLGRIAPEILCREIKIKGLITLKEEIGREKTSEYHDYNAFCKECNIDYIGVNSYDFKDSVDVQVLNNLEIDLLIVTGWQRLLPDWLIQKCTIGVIGGHGSAEGIINGRGRSPQNWALLLGKKEFDISIFWIDIGTDNGEIIDTSSFRLEETDTIVTSYIKTNMLIARMILDNLKNGKIEKRYGIPQPKDGFYLPKRIRQDGKIDWNRSSHDIYDMVRALTKPYPGAYTTYGVEEYYIYRALPIDLQTGYEKCKAGEVVSSIEGNLLVKCGKGLLLICEWSNEIQVGMVFDSADYVKQMEEIISRHNEKYTTPLSHMILDVVKCESE